MRLKDMELVGATMQPIKFLERHKLRVYDDGWGKLYLFGNEFGPTWVIRARSLETAYDIWLDEQPTVPKDELYLAYGFSSEKAFNDLMKAHPEYPLSLPKGYEYQPNASGTGIVEVGYYEWFRELTQEQMDRHGIKLQVVDS